MYPLPHVIIPCSPSETFHIGQVRILYKNYDRASRSTLIVFPPFALNNISYTFVTGNAFPTNYHQHSFVTYELLLIIVFFRYFDDILYTFQHV